MDRLSDKAIEIINQLHTERLDYDSEYIPLIDAAQRLEEYENTGLEPEEVLTGLELAQIAVALTKKKAEKELPWISVEYELPPFCGMGCLLCGTNCYGQQRVFEGFTGYMEGGKFQWHTNLKDIDLNVWNVTHWMPLPKPPEEE